MTGFVKENLARGEYILAALLDIEGAFSNVTTSSIESSLKEIHAPDFLVRFITHMLSNRLIRSNQTCNQKYSAGEGAIPSIVNRFC